jgi:hypothetical protein
MAGEWRPSKAAVRFCNGKLVKSEDKASGGFGKGAEMRAGGNGAVMINKV